MGTLTATELNSVLNVVTSWLDGVDDVLAVALVGSYARGAARPDSDVDVMILMRDPAELRRDTRWVHAIPWARIGRRLVRWEDADYGAAWSRHVLLANDRGPARVDGRVLEVELCFAGPSWARTSPVDDGTHYVMKKGCRVLRDRGGLMRGLLTALS